MVIDGETEAYRLRRPVQATIQPLQRHTRDGRSRRGVAETEPSRQLVVQEAEAQTFIHSDGMSASHGGGVDGQRRDEYESARRMRRQWSEDRFTSDPVTGRSALVVLDDAGHGGGSFTSELVAALNSFRDLI